MTDTRTVSEMTEDYQDTRLYLEEKKNLTAEEAKNIVLGELTQKAFIIEMTIRNINES